MASATLRIEAPSDAQLRYIAGLCEERGLEPPAAIYSKADASECIAAILERRFAPSDFAAPSSSPTYDDADYYGDERYRSEDVPF